MKATDDTAKHLDAARAVLGRCGGPGAVDGMTREQRRDVLSVAREELVELAPSIHGAPRKDARALVAKITTAIEALADRPLARRKRPLVARVLVPMVVAIVARLDRCAAVGRNDPEGAAFRALLYLLQDWLETWWNVDDYLAEGFACYVVAAVPRRGAAFRAGTADPCAAELAAVEVPCHA